LRQSATSTITHAVTGAAGVYAPGHLGELTQYLPFEVVDDVLEQTGTTQRRLRDLPSRTGVYFLLALGLFPGLGYARVWRKLTAGLTTLAVPCPSEKALRDLRRRLGAAPMKALFEVVAGPLAQPHTPGVRFRGLRTVAFDGCSSIKVPDTERNRCWLGRIRYRMGFAGYPTLRLMTLVETGTRGLLGAVIGGAIGTPGDLARRLLSRLGPGMLLLADRNFAAGHLLAMVTGRRSHLLVRAKTGRGGPKLPVLHRLSDGSYRSAFAGQPVRVIDAEISIKTKTGTLTGVYRLITTLLDTDTYPATAILPLYHERWEIEGALAELKTHLRGARIVLRSKTPELVRQEFWGLLLAHFAVRGLMHEAALPADEDPDRLSFLHAVRVVRRKLPLFAALPPCGQARPA